MEIGKEIRDAGRDAQEFNRAYAKALLRNASSDRRSGSAKRPGDARACGYRNDTDLYTR